MASYSGAARLRKPRHRYEQRASELVRRHWFAIQDVSDELLRRGTVTGERLVTIIARANIDPCA
jgi:hypothetical protein